MCEHHAEEIIWTQEAGTNRRLENVACEELHNVYSSRNINKAIESRIM
jgi:hypothetical protein